MLIYHLAMGSVREQESELRSAPKGRRGCDGKSWF